MPTDVPATREELLRANLQRVLEFEYDGERSRMEVEALLHTMDAFPKDRLGCLLDATLMSIDDNGREIMSLAPSLTNVGVTRPFAHKMRGAVSFKSSRFDAALAILDTQPDTISEEEYRRVRKVFEEEYHLVRTTIRNYRNNL